MVAKNKLTLATVKKVVGVGELVEKTIHFIDSDGNEFEGLILVKRISHDEKINAIDVWELEDRQKATLDQLNKAILFCSIYSDANSPFFSNIHETGTIPTEIIEALFNAADEVNDLSGKKKLASKEKNSGVNLSSMELVETPLKKRKEK